MTQPQVNSVHKIKASLIIVSLFVFLLSSYAFAGGLFKEFALKYREEGYEAQKKGMFQEALTLYQKAVSVDPLYTCGYNDLGIIYEMVGQGNAAEYAYLKAITLDPEYANAYTNLALLYEKRGDYLSAAKYWIKRAYLGKPGDLWVKKAQERIYEIGRVIPEVKKLYCPRDSSSQSSDDGSAAASYFENPDRFFEEKQSRSTIF